METATETTRQAADPTDPKDLAMRDALQTLLADEESPLRLARVLSAYYRERGALLMSAGDSSGAEQEMGYSSLFGFVIEEMINELDEQDAANGGPAPDVDFLNEIPPDPNDRGTNDPADAPQVDLDACATYPSEEARARRSEAPLRLMFHQRDLDSDGNLAGGWDDIELLADMRDALRVEALFAEDPTQAAVTISGVSESIPDDAGTVMEERIQGLARYIRASYNRCRSFPLNALEDPNNRLVLLFGNARGASALVPIAEWDRLRTLVVDLMGIATEYERLGDADTFNRLGLHYLAEQFVSNNLELMRVTRQSFAERLAIAAETAAETVAKTAEAESEAPHA